MKKKLAIIPARGSSKGIPNKNIQLIGNMSLLEIAIRAAYDAQIFDEVFISTDEKIYQSLATSLGGSCPVLRSQEASTSSATSESVVIEVLRYFEEIGIEFDTYALLEPSSPVRFKSIIRDAINACTSTYCYSACTVTPVPIKYHSRKQLYVDDDGFAFCGINARDPLKTMPRQLLKQSYIRNGLIYAGNVNVFKREKSILSSKNKLIQCNFQTFNIDERSDLDLARKKLRKIDFEHMDTLYKHNYHFIESIS